MEQLTLREHSSLMNFKEEIRPFNNIKEYKLCEELQEKIWGKNDVVRVPLLDLITSQQNGGVVLGAFIDKKLVGFVYSFPGITDTGLVKLCSVVLGTDPDYRNLGIGFRLKMAQKNAALEKGIGLITWTYDPLLSPNAYLNIGKLNAKSGIYLENYYGEADGLNYGIQTDRILVEWNLLETDKFLHYDLYQNSESVITTRVNNGLREPLQYDLGSEAEIINVEIPSNFYTIKNLDLDLSKDWQSVIRETFESYFKKGYIIYDFRVSKKDTNKCFYILKKEGVF